jgi:TusA-related sulfurtransferase
MEPGKILEVLVTDPQIIRDLPSVLSQGNDQLIKVDQQREVYRLYLRRGEQKLSGA